VQINSRVSICHIALLAGLLAGCSATLQPDNEPIAQIDENTGYRRLNFQSRDDFGDTVVLLAFSGGGTRAAALCRTASCRNCETPRLRAGVPLCACSMRSI